MNSNIMNALGLGWLDPAYLFIGLLAVILIILALLIQLFVKFSKLQKRYHKFMQGKEAKSLEKEIVGLYEDNKLIKTLVDKNKKDIRILFKNMEFTFQKLGIVKYDAFSQMGGKLSFSLALLNERNDGFILNSVHSSDGCYSYTKRIVNGTCDIDLGEEEKEALERAMESGE